MSDSDEDNLEKKLLDAGKKLLDPLPSLFQMLLQLLDELFLCLSKVEQNPPGSIEDALSPLKNALVAERLLKHSNVNVKVAVTCCIIEVTRITAPNAPYDDDKMREVLQLVVSSFEHLADIYSPSYTQRAWILDTVAKVKLFRLVLDLGCDALLIETFQHFLKALRDDHPKKVVLDMENIMTLVLEESDELHPELLSPILHYVRKDDEVPQVSRRLAEKVLSNCASKLKTYLTEAAKPSGVSSDKYYSNVVASICEGTINSSKQSEDTQKAAELFTPEQTCVRRLNLEHSLPHDSSVNVNGHESVSTRGETIAEAVVKTEEPEETQTHKRARVQSCSLHKAASGAMEKRAAEGEPSCPTQKSSPEAGDLQRREVHKPCSVTHQLAKVKQSIVDTLTSVRQFRSELETKEQSIVDTITSVRQFSSELETKEQSIVDTLTSVRWFQFEIKKKEDNLEASLQEVDVLGEKILGINEILNS